MESSLLVRVSVFTDQGGRKYMEDVTEVIVEPEPGEDEPMSDEPGHRNALECTTSPPTEDKRDRQTGKTDSSSFVSDAPCATVKMENEGTTVASAIRGGQSPPPAGPSSTGRCRRSVAFFAVFDGHGGCEAAQFARNYLWDFVKKQRGFWSDCDREVCSALRKGFVACHHAMWKKLRKFTDASVTNVRDDQKHNASRTLQLNHVVIRPASTVSILFPLKQR